MSGYKVSYKVLSQQGETLKALAKDVDQYITRLDRVRGRLGDDDLLVSVRQNLQKLSQQLGESRVVLNMAGTVVEKCVDGYGGIEKATVKKVDSTRAHNRDFYKNPVVVVSAEATAAAGVIHTAPGGMGGGAPAPSGNSILGNSIPGSAAPGSNISGGAPTATPTASPGGGASFTPAPSVSAEPAPSVTYIHENITIQTEPAASAGISGAGVAAAALGGTAAGAGALFGAQKLREFLKKKEQNPAGEKSDTTGVKTETEKQAKPSDKAGPKAEHKAKSSKPAEPAEEDPEVLLARARAEVEKYRKKDDTPSEPSM